MSYFEAGTILTPNHGHTAMMGVFGMLALALMVVLNLFPAALLQLQDVLANGYWHARGPEFLTQPFVRGLEWLRVPADMIFIGIGVFSAVIAAGLTYKFLRTAVRVAGETG